MDGSVDPTFRNVKVGGSLNELGLGPEGRVYVAGDFNKIDGIAKNNFAVLTSDGRLPEAVYWGPITKHEEGSIGLEITPGAHGTFALEESVDLKEWFLITTFISDSGNPRWSHQVQTSDRMGFFRVRPIESVDPRR